MPGEAPELIKGFFSCTFSETFAKSESLTGSDWLLTINKQISAVKKQLHLFK